MQPLGHMGRKIAVLVNRTALDRQVLSPEGGDCRLKTRPTIDAHQGGLRQTTRIRVLQELSPCRRALPRHVLNGREQLLPVPSHAQGRQQGDGSGLVISRVQTTMPSSSRWMTAAAARLRWRHASHSPFTLHQARLTTSFLTAPLKSANNAFFTCRVWAPAGQTDVSNAATLLVRR